MQESAKVTAAEPAPPQPAARVSWGRRVLAWLVAAYGAAIVAMWAWMILDGDRGWLATLVLFGPRWMCSIPLPFLALAAALWHGRLLVPLAAVAVMIAGPIMGLQVHLPARAAPKPSLRVVTCNVDEHVFHVTWLADLIEQEQPDIVALQEIRADTVFIWPPGWHVVERDEFILASRWPIIEREHVRRPVRNGIAAIRFSLQLPDREIQVFNLHLSTPAEGLGEVLSGKAGIDLSAAEHLQKVVERRALESQQTSDWIAGFPGGKIIMGDFNMPSDSTIFRLSWSPWIDAFSTVGWGLGFTKTSQVGAWSYGSRIDHVLSTPGWRPLRCWIGPDIGSDHMPLVAEFE